MRMRSHLFAVGPILVLALVLVGCGKRHKDTTPKPAETGGNPLKPDPAGGPAAQSEVLRDLQLPVIKNVMTNLGVYYQSYRNDHNDKPPRTREEFKAYLQKEPDARFLVRALDKDWLVLVLDPPPSTTQVLAYEKEPYKKWNNRVVLLGGGAVELMDNSAFQAALKGQ